MSGKAATIKDVAKLAKVSAATVSNVLGGQKPVRQVSRDAVLHAVAALNYQADPAAAYLRTGRSRVIAAVVPSLENPFFSTFVASVERLCQRDGYELFVASSEGNAAIEDKRVRALLQWRPAAFFVMPTGDVLGARGDLERAGVPFAVADRRLDDAGHDFVEIDNEAAGALAARHLADLGHRAIAIFAPSFEVANIRQRVEGIRSVLATVGAPEPILVEVAEEIDDDAFASQGVRVPREITAAIALTNFITLRLLGGLTREARRVPEDVSLVGFDDYAWMSVASPSVTAIRQPIAEMSGAVWRRLLSRIDGTDGPPAHEKFAAELMVRESTRALRQ